MSEKAAIYHFTDKSEIRPIVYQKELDRLMEFAGSMGYEDPDVYLDFTLRRCDQREHERLISNAEQYTAIIAKDFYHLAKNAVPCLNLMASLNNRGVRVITMVDGAFSFCPAPVRTQRSVALYYCGLEITRPVDLQKEIMRMYVRNETDWTITGEYIDTEGNRSASNQSELQRMIKEKGSYDLVFTRSFNDLNWLAAKFCKYRHDLGCDIYSLHEDVLLPYAKGGQYE